MSLQRNPLPPRRRGLIFGMFPWMFWTLLAAVVFAQRDDEVKKPAPAPAAAP